MMTRTMIATIMASFLCFMSGPVIENRVDIPVFQEDATFSIDFGENGIPFETFVADYAKLSGKRLFYDARRVMNKRITGVGNMTFKKKNMESVYGTIFLIHDLALIRSGDPQLNIVLIEDIKTSQSLKVNARFITLEELVDTPFAAEVVSVVVPVQHADVDKCQRAVNNVLQDHRSGFAFPMPSAGLLVVTSFPSRVRLMVKIIRELDAAAALMPKKPVEVPEHDTEEKSDK